MNARARHKARAACKREGHGWKGEGRNKHCWRCGKRPNAPGPKAGVARVERLEERVARLEAVLKAAGIEMPSGT